MHEIETVEAFEAWIDAGPDRPPAACQGLDLRDRPVLEAQDFGSCLFLGCRLSDAAAAHLVRTGATVLAARPDLPFAIHPSGLYTAETLFEGYDGPGGYTRTRDRRIYEHYLAQGGHHATSIATTLARRLHDHAITDALHEFLEGEPVVAVMGGHGLERGQPAYGAVARVARTLARRGYLLVSGGGPGAMEATHLGAWFAHYDEADLGDALALLRIRPEGAEPGREYADPDWLDRAWAVRERWPVEAPEHHSVGIPTWHYGHEPPNPFATRIAKYFANSVREEGLLAIADHGVIFARGSAGTTQEIFQDAAQNHYASFGVPAPMILLGRHYWTTDRPVWPLLEQVARGHAYHDLLLLTDDEQEVVQAIEDYRPA